MVLGLQPFAFAAFEDTGTGARPTALGGTYVAIGDDVQSLMYNPAGLAKMDRKEITSEYSRLYMGLSDGSNISQYFFGYGQRISYGGTIALGWKELTLDTLYTERTLSLGYGEWITDRVAVGFALKQLYHSYGIPNMIVDNSGNVQSGTPNFFLQNGNSNTAYSSDIGTLIRLTDRHTLGISIQDLNEPNIALSNAYRQIVPRTVRIGLASQIRQDFQLGASITTSEDLSNETDYTWTGSAEKWWKTVNSGDVGFRGSLATGSRSFQQAAFGPAYRFNSFQLDYTVVFNLTGIGLGDTAGTHRFSLTYRFGAEPVPPRKALKPVEPLIDSNPPTLGPWLDDIGDILGLLNDDVNAKPATSETPSTSTATKTTVPQHETPKAPVPELQGPHEPLVTQPHRKPAAAKPSLTEIPATYTAEEGDTLLSIAAKFYGDPERWRDIYALNSDRLGLGGFLTTGKVLVLPRKESDK